MAGTDPGARAHKVATGESLESLARHVGMTGLELARFNLGTGRPELINAALRAYVGCMHKTRDGRQYVFDSADDPGIDYLPGPRSTQGGRTGAVQRYQVRVPRYRVPIQLQTMDLRGHAVPNVELVLARHGGGDPIEVRTGGTASGRSTRFPSAVTA